jgi:hypothetical protein
MVLEVSSRLGASDDASTVTEVTVEPSAWDSLACSFWSIFDHKSKSKDIKAVRSEDAYNFPECDYDKYPTNLYKQIEAKNWTAINHFILTGYWSGSFFADSTPPQEQACTWVTKYEVLATRKKRVLWTHLPIHAAISGGAPQGTIQLLIKIAPPTLRCADDCRMLPLHLAFRRGAPDEMVATIMEVFPEGVVVRDQQGRTPPECGTEGPNKFRGAIIQTVLQFNQRAFEKKVAKAQEEHIKKTELSLKDRDARIEHLKTALDLVRIRDDLTSKAFASIVADLRRFNAWYEENKPDLCSEEDDLREKVVRDLSEQMTQMKSAAESLRTQHQKRQKDSVRTLTNLNGMWGEGIAMNKVTNFSFDELLRNQLRADEVSILSADSNIKTKGVVKAPSDVVEAKTEVAKAKPTEVKSVNAAKEGSKVINGPAEVAKAKDQAAKANSTEVKSAYAPNEGPEVIENTEGVPHDKDVPNEVCTPDEEDNEIHRAISEMTSMDDITEAQYSMGMGDKMKSFRKGLKAITKTAAKKIKKVDVIDDLKNTDSKGLPPKKKLSSAISIKSSAEKRQEKMIVLDANRVLVSPTF